jgi:hypothetical protein
LVDYARGIFHEPFFYGQDYNPMIESLLAVPLYWFGLEPRFALPMVTMLLGLLPFFLFGRWFIGQKQWAAAAVMFIWPTLMPLEYQLASNLPRGFIGGIAVASVAAFGMAQPRRVKSILLASFALPVGVITCSNSALMVAFLLPYFWFSNRKNPTFYVSALVGFGLTALLLLAGKSFYISHPERLTHDPWNAYKLDWIWAAFRDREVGTMLKYNIPFFPEYGALALGLAFILSIWLLIKKQVGFGLGAMAVVVVSILALGHSRIYSGTEHIFFPYSRNWLALPVVLSLCVALVLKGNKLRLPIGLGILFLSIVSIGIQLNDLPVAREKALTDKSHSIIAAFEVDSLLCECNELKELAIKNEVKLIMQAPYRLNRGCPILVEDFPPIMTNFSDRLLSNVEKNALRPVNRILLYNSVGPNQIAKTIQWQSIEGRQKSLIIKDFPETPLALMDSIEMKVDSTRREWFHMLIESRPVR